MARQSGVVLLLVAALLSSASVQAQGNFACKNSSSDGPDQSICSALRVPSSTPVESQCVKVGATDRYFCGMQNARRVLHIFGVRVDGWLTTLPLFSSCTEASQCDHGTCLITDPSSSVPGICTYVESILEWTTKFRFVVQYADDTVSYSGGYAQNCIVDGAPSSSACLGTLGCSPRDGTCGGAGAVCDQQGLPDNNSCTSGESPLRIRGSEINLLMITFFFVSQGCAMLRPFDAPNRLHRHSDSDSLLSSPLRSRLRERSLSKSRQLHRRPLSRQARLLL